MINNRINKVKAEGNNIFVFQYIDGSGNKTEKRKPLQEFLKPFIEPNLEKIKLLEINLADKTELLGYKNTEVIQLSGEIQELQKKNEELEKQISQFLEGLEGKDLSQNSDLYQIAFELFTHGEIDEAILVLDDAKMEEDEKRAQEEMKQRAETRLLKAGMLKIKNRHEEATTNYEKVVELNDSWYNCLEVANYFQFINQFKKAEKYYDYGLLKAGSDEERALTLNNLAVFQKTKNEYEKAELTFLEALNIYRKLAKINPQFYLFYVAGILNNLSNLLIDIKKYNKANQCLLEALDINRKLVKIDSQKYLPDVGATLNNLANFHSSNNELDQAEAYYNEALKIYGTLTEVNPQKYVPFKAIILNNFGLLKSSINKMDHAESFYNEALGFYTKLAKVNPRTYLPLKAHVLNNLGLLKRSENRFNHAESFYNEALKIRRELAKVNPQTYLPDLANTLNNLANLKVDEKKGEQAENFYLEVLEIRKKLIQGLPQINELSVADTYLRLSILYKNLLIDKNRSVAFAEKAVIILKRSKVPYAGEMSEIAQLVLIGWKKPSNVKETSLNSISRFIHYFKTLFLFSKRKG